MDDGNNSIYLSFILNLAISKFILLNFTSIFMTICVLIFIFS